VVVVRAEDRALVADQLLAGLAVVYEGAFVVDAVAGWGRGYAGATGVCEIEEI
jgi:hypothetical protein